MARIVHVITAMTYGGAQRLLLEMLPRLRAREHDVHLVCLRKGPLTAAFRDTGVTVHELNVLGLRSPLAVAVLVDLLRDLRPQIVHTHLGKADFFGRIAARMARVPVILSTAHNIEDWKQNPIYRWVDTSLGRITSVVVAVADAVRRDLIRRSRIEERKIRTIYNGIDVRKYPLRVKPVGEPHQVVLGSVGRLEPQKGHSVLLRALVHLRQECGLAPRCLIVGEGSLRPALTQMARDMGILDQLDLVGASNDVGGLMREAFTLFVLPSLWEGLPLTVLEAMACGVPVVASQVGGVPEVIQDGVTGYLVEPGSPEKLAQAIFRALANPERLIEIAHRAREHVAAKFDITQTVGGYDAVYQECLAGVS